MVEGIIGGRLYLELFTSTGSISGGKRSTHRAGHLRDPTSRFGAASFFLCPPDKKKVLDDLML
jgi:hypothetical protein